MCIHGPKNSYLGKSTPHPSGQEAIPILSLGASPLGIELELPLGPRDIGVDFPRYEFLSPWIPPIFFPSYSDIFLHTRLLFLKKKIILVY